MLVLLPRQRQILAVADGEIHLDGVELGHRGQHRLWAHQVAHLRGCLAGHT